MIERPRFNADSNYKSFFYIQNDSNQFEMIAIAMAIDRSVE